MSRNPLNLALRASAHDSTEANGPLVFLACPYSDPDEGVRGFRALLASDTAARLMRLGYSVFSPISHGHAICEADSAIGTDAPAWVGVNDAVLSLCHALLVVGIPGVAESAGVQHEMALAGQWGVPITMVAWRGDWVTQPVEADFFTALKDRP